MLVHDRFVFLHVPKTGGTFIRRALRRELAGEVRPAPGHRHAGWDHIPTEAARRPVLLYVRNPWDWYVSWYHFVQANPAFFFSPDRPGHGLFRYLFADGANDFATTVLKACAMRDDLDGAEAVRRIAAGHDLADLLAAGHDFYTARFLFAAGAGHRSDLLTIGRFESLVDDLGRFLSEVGLRFADPALERLRCASRVNASNRPSYRDSYPPALRDVLGDSCSLFTERFGYRFADSR